MNDHSLALHNAQTTRYVSGIEQILKVLVHTDIEQRLSQAIVTRDEEDKQRLIEKARRKVQDDWENRVKQVVKKCELVYNADANDDDDFFFLVHSHEWVWKSETGNYKKKLIIVGHLSLRRCVFVYR